MKNFIDIIKGIHKLTQENPLAGSLTAFLYIFIGAGVVIVFLIVVKGFPWIINILGGLIYRPFAHKKEGLEEETYHHIDKPLKKLDF